MSDRFHLADIAVENKKIHVGKTIAHRRLRQIEPVMHVGEHISLNIVGFFKRFKVKFAPFFNAELRKIRLAIYRFTVNDGIFFAFIKQALRNADFSEIALGIQHSGIFGIINTPADFDRNKSVFLSYNEYFVFVVYHEHGRIAF